MIGNFMTFNLKYDFSNDEKNKWNLRLKRICKIIKDNEPLCIGIQEGLIHMLEDISKELPEYLWIGEGREGERKGEFNAIFYKNNKFKIINWGQFWLSETPHIKNTSSWDSACKRICTWAILKEFNSEKRIYVYNTHLDYKSSLAREKGITLILDFVKEKYEEDNIPFSIMGDFNCFLNDKVFEILKSYNNSNFKIKNIYDENNNIRATFHDFKGGYDDGIIDYILFSKEFKINKSFIDHRLINGGYPSDHYPVITNLEY